MMDPRDVVKYQHKYRPDGGVVSAVLIEDRHDGPYQWPRLHSDGRPDTVGDLQPLARRLRRAGARVRVEVRG